MVSLTTSTSQIELALSITLTRIVLGSILDEEIKKRTVEFDEKFESKFELATKGLDQTMIKFAQAAMSNMLGGIGFFFGASKVQSEYNPEPIGKLCGTRGGSTGSHSTVYWFIHFDCPSKGNCGSLC